MPLQSAMDNLKQKLTQMGTAAQAVGLEDHRAMLAATRQRTREGHEATARAAGFKPIPIQGTDEMGDLIVTGDIQLDRSQREGGDAIKTGSSGPLKTIGAALLGAALVGGPLFAYLWASRDKSPAVVNTDENTQNTIRPDDLP